MEEMQEALKGKSRQSQAIDCMLSEAECSFSTDSLDDRAIRDESSQRDSSTMISEFSSTRTLMNIDDEGKRCSEEEDSSPKGFFLSRRFSDSVEIEGITEYSWEMSTSNRETILDHEIKTEIKTEQKTRSERSSKVARKKKLESSEATKLLSASVPAKSKRDGSGTSKSSNLQTVKLSRMDRTTPTRGTTVKARSPSPILATKVNESTSTDEKQRRVTCKSNSPSPTRLDKSKLVKSSDKLVATKPTKSVRSKEETLVLDTTESNEAASETAENIGEVTIENESTMELLKTERRKKIVLDFDEFPPPRTEKKSCVHSDHSNVPETGVYLSPIEENSEASTGSGQNKFVASHYGGGKTMEATLEYDHARKYHTYPKSRIPIARWSKERRYGNLMMDPKMYPLEPREIDLDAFQQLHTADSQEELQEFLLLESQCSGNLGLAGNMSASEVSCSEHHSEDERGTMSGILVD